MKRTNMLYFRIGKQRDIEVFSGFKSAAILMRHLLGVSEDVANIKKKSNKTPKNLYPLAQTSHFNPTIDEKYTSSKKTSDNEQDQQTKKTIEPHLTQSGAPQQEKTIKVQPAKTIEPQPAKTIELQPSKTIELQQAKTIEPQAAKLAESAKAKICARNNFGNLDMIPLGKILKRLIA